MTSPSHLQLQSLAALLQEIDAIVQAPDTSPAEHESLIASVATLIAERVGHARALTLATEVLRAIGSSTAGTLALPETLYRDSASGLLQPAFFANEYPRYGRGENSLVLLRYEFALNQATEEQVGAMIGDLIRESVRTVDVPCRWKACEFLILLPRTSIDQASIVAKRIHDAQVVQQLPRGALTIGIAHANNGEPFDQVYGRASWAVYNAQVTNPDEIGFA